MRPFFLCARKHLWQTFPPGHDLSNDYCPECAGKLHEIDEESYAALIQPPETPVSGAAFSLAPYWYDARDDLHRWQGRFQRCDECFRIWKRRPRFCNVCGMSYRDHMQHQRKVRRVVALIDARKKARR